ncbi:hypothetical protein C2E23DRAFT_416984 [Lenzites betulinus]|nr:hypothetical protein C2E23DRAFT_416984 [Lenzites betulinus]
MGELIRLVSKLRGVGGDVFMEKDVMRSIKTAESAPCGLRTYRRRRREYDGAQCAEGIGRGPGCHILDCSGRRRAQSIRGSAHVAKGLHGRRNVVPGRPSQHALTQYSMQAGRAGRAACCLILNAVRYAMGRVAKLKNDVRSSVYYERMFCIIVSINASYSNGPFPCQNASIYIDPRQLPCAGPACGMIRCRGIYLRSASQSDLVQGL